MQHEIINSFEEVPSGYVTYSALLIPEYGWFDKQGTEHAYEFFNHFKKIGQIVGKDHLTFWFYYSFFGYATGFDCEVVAAINQSKR